MSIQKVLRLSLFLLITTVATAQNNDQKEIKYFKDFDFKTQHCYGEIPLDSGRTDLENIFIVHYDQGKIVRIVYDNCNFYPVENSAYNIDYEGFLVDGQDSVIFTDEGFERFIYDYRSDIKGSRIRQYFNKNHLLVKNRYYNPGKIYKETIINYSFYVDTMGVNIDSDNVFNFIDYLPEISQEHLSAFFRDTSVQKDLKDLIVVQENYDLEYLKYSDEDESDTYEIMELALFFENVRNDEAGIIKERNIKVLNNHYYFSYKFTVDDYFRMFSYEYPYDNFQMYTPYMVEEASDFGSNREGLNGKEWNSEEWDNEKDAVPNLTK